MDTPCLSHRERSPTALLVELGLFRCSELPLWGLKYVNISEEFSPNCSRATSSQTKWTGATRSRRFTVFSFCLTPEYKPLGVLSPLSFPLWADMGIQWRFYECYWISCEKHFPNAWHQPASLFCIIVYVLPQLHRSCSTFQLLPRCRLEAADSETAGPVVKIQIPGSHKLSELKDLKPGFTSAHYQHPRKYHSKHCWSFCVAV